MFGVSTPPTILQPRPALERSSRNVSCAASAPPAMLYSRSAGKHGGGKWSAEGSCGRRNGACQTALLYFPFFWFWPESPSWNLHAPMHAALQHPFRGLRSCGRASRRQEHPGRSEVSAFVCANNARLGAAAPPSVLRGGDVSKRQWGLLDTFTPFSTRTCSGARAAASSRTPCRRRAPLAAC